LLFVAVVAFVDDELLLLLFISIEEAVEPVEDGGDGSGDDCCD
jgi:hypothetical protein